MDNSIDLVNDITFNSIPNAAAYNNNTDPAAKNISDTMIRSNFALLLDNAVNTSDIDLQAVEQAKALNQNADLDTPPNTLEAAENILTYGI